MNIEILAIGKTKTRHVQEGLADYFSRLKRYVPVTLTELPDVKNAGRLPEQQQKEEEGKAFLQKITSSDYVIVLDERGRQLTSRKFSEKLQQVMASGRKRLLFLIGGPYGFSDDVYRRADEKLSLSEMTFNHEMVRLFFVEQIYRAMTIIRGEPYHHD